MHQQMRGGQGFSVDVRHLFKQEVRVIQDKRAYWLPIQEEVLKYFKDEVASGGSATLYVMYFGCKRNIKDSVIAVAINDFEAQKR
jgi:uncharacterized protein YneR